MARVLAVLALVLAAAAGWIVWLVNARPDLSAYDRYALPAASGSVSGRLDVTFLGVATLLFDDGETRLMTDGWFTRVPTSDVLLARPVAPDTGAIERGLARAGVRELAAVMPVHSHYDHAQDAPEVARRTGALLLGSETTAWIGRGGGLAEEQIAVAEPGVARTFGAFRVTHVVSKHVRLPFGAGRIGEALDAPLVPPVPAMAYPEGGSWSILIEHPLGSVLVQGSAGFVPGALAGRRADTVLLGVGGLARHGDAYLADYFREIVEAVGAGRVIPIHYDDLAAPTDGALVPGPRLMGDVRATFDWLVRRAASDRELEFALLRYWEPVTLFESR